MLCFGSLKIWPYDRTDCNWRIRNLGQNGSRYFLMAAIITGRSKTFRKAYKVAPTSNGPEIKFYNAKPRERINVLEEVAKAGDISINVGKNVKDCKKVSVGRCTGIADYIVGAVCMKYENKNSEFFWNNRRKDIHSPWTVRATLNATDITGLIRIIIHGAIQYLIPTVV